MTHTITVTLSLEAQRAALLAGEPAEREQTYEVPQELMPRLLALPCTKITAEGNAVCRLADLHYRAEYFEPPGTPIQWHSSGYSAGDLSVRPKDAIAAIQAIEDLMAKITQKTEESRTKYADEKAATHAQRAEEEKREREKQLAALERLEKDPSPAIKVLPSGLKQWRDDNIPGMSFHGDGFHLSPDLRPRLEALRKRVEPELKRAAEERAAIVREAERRLLAEYGTQAQRERWEVGRLPDEELRVLACKVLFAPLEDLPRYQRITEGDLDDAENGDADCDHRLVCGTEEYDGPLTEKQWVALRAVENKPIRDASVTVLAHNCECIECGATVTRYSARVSIPWADRTLTREYALG